MAKDPIDELEEVIRSNNLIDLGSEYAEIAIDSMIEDNTLKDIPVIRTIVGLIKFRNSFSKYLFTKKIYKFLFNIKDIPQTERVKTIEKINSSKKYQSKVGLIILELLEKVESDYKPEILGKLFSAVIKEKIEFSTFLRLAHIISNLFIEDIHILKRNVKGQIVYPEALSDSILISGLVTYGISNANLKYQDELLSPLGYALYKYGLQ